MARSLPAQVTWADAEKLFAQADLHKPEKKRFTKWKQSQTDAMLRFHQCPERRFLIFYPTGEGKTRTGLALIADDGWDEVLILCPAKTKEAWVAEAAILGLKARVMTHQMFMQDHVKPSKSMPPIIVDEVHKLGKRTGVGWKKLYKWTKSAFFTMPLVMMSATPPYNEEERLWCMEVLCDPAAERNYEEWLRANCRVQAHRYRYYPEVLGLLNYATTADFLADRWWCAYVQDTAEWAEDVLHLPTPDLDIFEGLGYSTRDHRIVASIMEKHHKRVDHRFVNDFGYIRADVLHAVSSKLAEYPDRIKWLVFCSHKTVADALARTLDGNVWIITGDTKEEDVEPIKQEFIRAQGGWLIGTTAIAEGVDGLDDACQSLLLLDPLVGDEAKTRQVIGRILPRGNEDDRERLVITAVFE